MLPTVLNFILMKMLVLFFLTLYSLNSISLSNDESTQANILVFMRAPFVILDDGVLSQAK